MSDIRFNRWLHQSGTGGVSQSDGGHVGIGTTNPLIPVGAGNTHILNVGVVTCNNISAGSSITATTFYGSGANLTGITAGLSNIVEDTSPQLGGTLDTNNQDITFNGAQNVSWDSSAADLIFNDYAKINLGTDKDFKMYQAGNNTILQSDNTSGGVYLQGSLIQVGSETGEVGVKFVKDGAVELHHDNVKALSTSSTGINVWGRSGNGILDIYPTGSAVYSILNLHNTVGGTAYNAQLIATSGQSVYLGSGNTGDVVLRTGNSQNKVVGRHNGATELYHSSNKKFETTNTGATVTGNLAFASGNGIDFSATGGPAEGSGTSELFHDYEEGTFTPVWKFSPNNATGVTYNIQTGHYVKVGGVVFIRIELQVSNKGSLTGAGYAQIDGLPYACSSYSAVSIGIYQHFNNVQPGIAHVGTSEQVYIAYDPSLSSNTSSYDLQHTYLTNNSRINISGTYYAV